MERIFLKNGSGVRIQVELERETEESFLGAIVWPKARGGWVRLGEVLLYRPYWERADAPS